MVNKDFQIQLLADRIQQDAKSAIAVIVFLYTQSFIRQQSFILPKLPVVILPGSAKSRIGPVFTTRVDGPS